VLGDRAPPGRLDLLAAHAGTHGGQRRLEPLAGRRGDVEQAARRAAEEARRALERALDLDAGLESARALLKKLRWSFLG
jgi:hypothetical protein